MKNYYLSLTMSALSFCAFSQSISWNSPVTVANGGTYSNVYPRITLTENDIPVVSWENSNSGNIYAARWNGASFNMPLTINPSGVMPFIADWAGSEIASSGDTVFIAFSTDFSQTSKIYTVRSLDGGMTFQDTVRVDQIGTDVARFPTIAVGNNGNPLVAFMRLDSGFGNAEYAVARSMSGGNSYMSSITPSLGAIGTVCDCCPATIIADGNNHVVTYRNNDNNIRNMWASYSTDGSASYPNSSEIDETDWMIMSCPSSGPSNVMAGDSLISTWMSNGKVYVGTTNLTNQQNGMQFQLFPMGMGTQNYPIIAGKGDTLAVVWQGSDAGTPRVFFTSSVSGASGLGVVIDTLTATFSGNQTRPDLQYSNGKFHVVYSDGNGNNVKYLTGTIGQSVGLNENAQSSLSMFISQSGENSSLHIKSNIQQNASITVCNSLGQTLLENNATLSKEESIIGLPNSISKGMCFITVTSEAGTVVVLKAVLNN
jgi:hypothetical protein